MENNNVQLVVKENWFKRNWKWVVPSGCLTLIVIFGLFVGSIFLGVTSLLKNSDVTQQALKKAQNNSELVQQIGQPIEIDGMITGNINTNNSSGNADISIPVKGSKGEATIYALAHKYAGKWEYDKLSVVVENNQKQIELK